MLKKRRAGRPPASLLDPDTPAPVAQDVREVDARGRLTIPARLVQGLSWIEAAGGASCLLVLDDPGRIAVLPWEKYRDDVLARRRMLLQDASNEESQEALLLLEDRYRRVRLEASGRITLPAAASIHLLNDPADRRAFIVRLGDHIELWSVLYRHAKLRARSDLFEGLP